jgi:D-alanyl-lipoteichoic acid acyltransferase DltB (MBOAT superfamily)
MSDTLFFAGQSALDLYDALVTGRAGFISRFVLAGLLFAALAAVLRRATPAVRAWGLVVSSLVLLALLMTPVVAGFVVADLLLVYAAVEGLPAGRTRMTVVVVLLALQAIGPIFWLPLLPGYTARVRELTAFATNVTLLRAWGYAYDRMWRPAPTRPTLRDYALFTFFFPAFVNGPLVSHEEFERRRLPSYWSEDGTGVRPEIGLAFRRIALGIALMFATMCVVWLGSERSAHADAVAGGSAAAWFASLRVYAMWYLAFSAWTEVAIGLGLLGGVVLPENFNAPHFAYGTADFWRRWNITFMVWLRRYVYLPLGGAYVRSRPGGARHLEWRNTGAVFGIVAVYHLLGGMKLLGPSYWPPLSYVPWLLWAALNTVAVLATRGLKRPQRLGVVGVAVVVTTLAGNCVGHMTAVFPPDQPLGDLATIYRNLVVP